MIQRIQTLYLLIAALLLGLVFLFPLIYFSDQGNQWTLYASCVKSTTECGLIQVFPIALITGLALVISIFTILSFKNRSFQMKLCKFNHIVLVVLLGIIGIYLFRIQAIIQVKGQLQFAVIFPVVALILNYLAHRAIKRDDQLVKSVDRIR